MNAASDESPDPADEQTGLTPRPFGPDLTPGAEPTRPKLAADPEQTRIGMTFHVAPLGEISGNLPRLLGESMLELLGMFYPSIVGKKANVVVTELVQNVLENVVDPHSELHLELSVDGDALVVRVRNKATPEQYEGVRARVDALSGAIDAKKLFTTTLRARRADRLKGGLGLMRLVSENRFRLAVSYERELLTMQAAFPLRGSV
jgi:hypothetical protein